MREHQYLIIVKVFKSCLKLSIVLIYIKKLKNSHESTGQQRILFANDLLLVEERHRQNTRRQFEPAFLFKKASARSSSSSIEKPPNRQLIGLLLSASPQAVTPLPSRCTRDFIAWQPLAQPLIQLKTRR